MSYKKKYPVYLKSSVTSQFLTKNPIYKNIFRRCPNCNQFSLKPIGIDRIADISQVMNSNERKCARCGYTHVKNLTVSTTTANNQTNNNIVIKEGRILEDQNQKNDNI